MSGDSLCMFTVPTIVQPASAKNDLHDTLPKIDPEPLNITETLSILPTTFPSIIIASNPITSVYNWPPAPIIIDPFESRLPVNLPSTRSK